MKLTFPNYYKKFTCIADKCTDTCCAGWDVVIDGGSLENYGSLGGEYGDKIRSLITVDGDGDSIFAARNGRCPFLLDSGLCDMFIHLGHGSLCRTCRIFPRFTNAFGARAETGLSLSCPEAARLIFESENPVTFETEETDGAIIPSDFDAELYFTLLCARKTAINILQSRNFSAGRRICAFLRYCEAVQEYINEYEYGEISGILPDAFLNGKAEFSPSRARRALKGIFAAFGSMEFINHDYSAKLKAAETVDMQGFSVPDTEFEHLAVYFVYRYFITAAYDGKLLEKALLAAACVAVIQRLRASENALTKEQRTEIAQKFSKEVEHSAMNMQILQSAIKKSRCFSGTNLINIFSEKEK